MALPGGGVGFVGAVGPLEDTPLVQLPHHSGNVVAGGDMPERAERRRQPVDVVLAPGQNLEQRKVGAARVGNVGPLEGPAARHERVAVAIDRHGLQPRK
jgi:hypothetical protein